MKMRRLIRILHRDIGYLCVGLILVYSISGIVANHEHNRGRIRFDRNDFNRPSDNLNQSNRESQFEAGTNLYRTNELVSSSEINNQQGFRRGRRGRSEGWFLAFVHGLHYNRPGGLWTYVSDLFVIALVICSLTGLFVLKGKQGIKGRGAWLTAIGIAIPIIFAFI